MQVVLVAVGSRGDVVPFTALANRLAQHGHGVVLVTHRSLLPPASEVDAERVSLVGVDSDPDELLNGPAAHALRRWDLKALNRTRGVFADFIGSVADPVQPHLAGADVLVASTFAMAAVARARAVGVPVVRAQFWPEQTALDGPMPVVPYSWRVPGWVRRRARGGLRRMEPLLAGFDGWWEDGKLQIVPHHEAGFTTSDLGCLHAYPSAFAPAAIRRPGGDAHRAVGAGPCDAVTGWWTPDAAGGVSARTTALLQQPGAPWVFCGFGSMPQRSTARLVDVVERACQAVGVRVLLQLADAPGPVATDAGGQRPAFEPGGPASPVHVIGHEPHGELFGHVVAAVHHAGSGTTGAAVRAGVPSVPVPHVADQFFWAHELRRLRVASAPLPRPLLSAPLLARRLEAALDADMAVRARELAARIEIDGTERAVQLLERAVDARRSGA